MRNNNHSGAACVIVLVALCSAWTLAPADADGPRQSPADSTTALKAIERRLDEVEKRVGPSREPLSSRLDTLDKALRDLTKAVGGAGWSSLDSNIREAQKAITAMTDFRRQSEHDLRELQRDVQQLRQLRDEIGQLRRTIDKMNRRLEQLESRSR
ncbi:MAG TPA: hypothetical protein P5081_16670 [Phycisphaerae bacterium]|nr:hypothetical protein [Phycisphaerae bacterium]HRW54505.1 hypothetical protein [Phycisphaerae bacterium]